MSWESRGGTARYFTRTIRVNGGFVREYHGRGQIAEFVANEFARKRDQRGRGERWRDFRKNLRQADKLVISFCDQTDVLLRATLLAAGFHRHSGEWRRRRRWPVIELTENPLATNLLGLVRQAQKANHYAVEAVKAYLNENTETWKAVVDLGQRAEAAWLRFLSEMAPEAVPEKMEVIAAARLRMNSSSRSPIIRLLIDRGIVTGLEAEVCDLLGRNGEGFHLPSPIRVLFGRYREKALKRHRRAQERLALAAEKLPSMPSERELAEVPETPEPGGIGIPSVDHTSAATSS